MLLVVLIFLMLSTTYSKFTELQVNLPAADAEQLRDRPARDHRLRRSRRPLRDQPQALDGRSVELLAAELGAAAEGPKDAVVIISADASAAHQTVINVLDAARRAGLPRLTFATQTSRGAAGR